ncbi:MAG: YerC/YecD family TrpR-related protein [Clostridia bacterium]|nr:YerC/YecD family TrpR-related protein [Clostridia bacterium]
MLHLKNDDIDNVFEAILSLKSVDECYCFFEDICTVKEIQDIAQRYQVALLLTQNKNYSEITNETGASSATITRVNKCLKYGNDGYKMVIERTKKD